MYRHWTRLKDEHTVDCSNFMMPSDHDKYLIIFGTLSNRRELLNKITNSRNTSAPTARVIQGIDNVLID